MPKQNHERMEEDSWRILAALQRNAKENIATIARQCHISKERCVRTIKNFEKNRRIWGYTAIVDDRDLQVKKFILLLKRTVKKFDERTLDEIVADQFISAYAPLGVSVESTYHVHGEYSWVVIFTAPDLIQAKKFSKILFDSYPGMASDVQLMQVVYTNRAYHIPNPDQSMLREYL
jgi:DNA-binding Lrp family transcriptional regulator